MINFKHILLSVSAIGIFLCTCLLMMTIDEISNTIIIRDYYQNNTFTFTSVYDETTLFNSSYIYTEYTYDELTNIYIQNIPYITNIELKIILLFFGLSIMMLSFIKNLK